MTNVRDIMTPGAECASVNDTLVEAARKMRDLDVGALPICGDDSKLAGMITDRDIVIRGLAADRDPSTAKVADLADGTPLREGELDRVDHLLATIACHSVVRAGDVLGRTEALALLGQLDAVDLRSHCPHGRPVLLRLPLGEIERRFGRA